MKAFPRVPLTAVPALCRDLASAGVSYLVDHLRAGGTDPADTILLTGFWRSGTTWLQQVLAHATEAKTVFEPLDPRVLRGPGGARLRYPPIQESGYLFAFMPWASELAAGDLRPFMERACRGDIAGRWVRRARRGIGESRRRRTVVKMVRGHFLAAALRESLSCRWVHLWRDPRAVVASVRRGGWWRGWLEELSPADQLLLPEDGRRDFFAPRGDRIRSVSEEDAVARVAAYWALTESFVAAEAAQSPVPVLSLQYEQILDDSPGLLAERLQGVGIDVPAPAPEVLRSHSPVTSQRRSSIAAGERRSGWRRELSPREIRAVEKAVTDFGMADRL